MNWLKVSQQVRNTFLFLITPAAERQWGSVTRGLIEPGKLSRLQCGGCLQQKVLFWFANSRMESALMRVASLDMRSSLQYQGKLTYREIYTHPRLFSESAPDWCTLLNFLNRCWGSAAGQHVVQTALRPNQMMELYVSILSPIRWCAFELLCTAVVSTVEAVTVSDHNIN